MGVYGLTSYLRENHRALAESGTRTCGDVTPINFVVDGWAFIYFLTNSISLPWCYGGEYSEYAQAVVRVVEAWHSLGITSHFVFDGAFPPSKTDTRIKRVTERVITRSLLFFRTSDVARNSPRFLSENSIIPPLTYQATIEILKTMEDRGVKLVMADNEGDAFTVELAAKLQGYAVSQDSDFVIFHSEGYKGYIPLDSLIWDVPATSEYSVATPDEVQPINFEELGFQVVKKPKARKHLAQSSRVEGLVPPPKYSGLSFTVLDPRKFATHLQLQLSILPLFASLIGTDYTGPYSPDKYFFEKRLSPSQRVTRVATTLRNILDPKAKSGTRAKAPSTGMEAISTAVERLLLRPDLVGRVERERLIEAVINSILQYAITTSPPETEQSQCPIHADDQCSLALIYACPNGSEADDEGSAQKIAVRDLYIAAYRQGKFRPELLDAIASATYWPHFFLEDPDRESCHVSLGRSIRLWTYALLEFIFGIPRVDAEDHNETSSSNVTNDFSENEDEDEIIDVAEEDTDEEDEESSHDSDEESDRADTPLEFIPDIREEEEVPLGPPVVVEYVRRGTRVADVSVDVYQFVELYPNADDFSQVPQLMAEDIRHRIFLRALRSDCTTILQVSPAQRVHVACLRYIVQVMSERSNIEERWTKREARAVLGGLLAAQTDTTNDDPNPELPLVNRHVQLIAQFLSVYENVITLLQVLLLTDTLPTSVLSISGQNLHRLLSSIKLPDWDDNFSESWNACCEGLDDCWGIERGARGKKARRQANNLKASAQASKPATSLFAALADLDLE